MDHIKNLKGKISVKGNEVAVLSDGMEDYICLTDIARYKNPDEPFIVICNWTRLHGTIEYLGLWEKLNNENFIHIEFDKLLSETGANGFTLSPSKWIEKTGAIGMCVKTGRFHGGTYAHKDIAFKFAGWISAEFELYLIKEFQRLKKIEQKALEWTAKRELAKVNYHIHTDAIKEHLIVPELTQKQISFVYANEADLLNVALFGKTAAEWRKENLKEKGNLRDRASVEQLLVLANMESYNAILIEQERPQSERIVLLNKTARKQLETLLKAQIDRSKVLGLPKDKEEKEEK
jgi:hypothetical protein